MSDFFRGKITHRECHSQQAYQREKKTLEKRLATKDQKLKQELWHLSNERFVCEGDAQKALNKIKQKHGLYHIKGQIVSIMKHTKRGRPKQDAKKISHGYRIEAEYMRKNEELEKLLNRKGRFILATNDSGYTDKAMLEEYKEQQNVEKGFRFLKDPWFMVDSVFLKLPRRIEGLMMIMTLCLMIYNIGQYKLRQKLQEEGDTLANQLGKEVKNPTLRWIFQIMEGIVLVRFYDSIKDSVKELVTNIDRLRKKIICLFGETARRIYGLIQRNCCEV